jgi:Uma2 family endonuclease
LTHHRDDGIVADEMSDPSVDWYLGGAETLRRRELAWGVVREPPAPFYPHQRLVTDLTVLLQTHVRDRYLGEVVVSPVDIVLDADNGLVLQPDSVFVSRDRLDIVRNQIWGAPDLVIEVISAATAIYDTGEKLGWYARYGVREAWLVDRALSQIDVCLLSSGRDVRAAYRRGEIVRSAVLSELRLEIDAVFLQT